ncbi:MAG: HIT domain-containing protein [bacterium]
MKPLWAPWRMQFILGKKEKGCVFCSLPKKKSDRESLIVYRGKKSYVILNKFPYNNGHLMVVPKRHTSDLAKLDAATILEMMRLVDRSIKILKKSMGSQGENVGLNFGHAAGAGILDHLHIHVVPRWGGDTNFMPVFSGSKVMVEYLYETYDRLYPFFNRITRRKKG